MAKEDAGTPVQAISLRLKWRWVQFSREWCAKVAECELFVRELSDGWYVQIDLNVVRTERTTIEHGPVASREEAQAWAESRLARHARIEASRMKRILKAFKADQ